MKVILTDRVKSLGNVGDIVNVSEGYARNFLIPNSFAVLADDKNKKVLENENKRLAKKIEAEKGAATEIKGKLDGLTLEFAKRVGGNGKIFGTISSTELAKALADKNIEVERRVIIVENPIKTLGNFNVKAKLFKGVEASFKVKVTMDEAQAEEIKKAQAAAAKKKTAKKDAPAEEAQTEEVATETTEA